MLARHGAGHLRHAFDNLGPYLRFTLEEQRMYERLVELGVTILSRVCSRFRPGGTRSRRSGGAAGQVEADGSSW